MTTAIRATQRLGALSRGAWGERRVQVFAETLLDGNIPAEWIEPAIRRLLVSNDPDQLSPARIIAEVRAYGDPLNRPALPEPPVSRETSEQGLKALRAIRKSLERRFTPSDDRGTAPRASSEGGRSDERGRVGRSG